MVVASHSRSSVLSHLASRGRSVIRIGVSRPRRMAGMPSMMYSHCQPWRPRMPSIWSSSPDTGAPSALETGWARMKMPSTVTRCAAGNHSVR
ncbi:hypothetical protein D9M69_715050 [compost metagenome]